MNKLLAAIFFCAISPAVLLAGPLSDGGVLIPRDQAQPNPAILSLEEMEVTVQIDNGDARVFVKQIFANHTDAIQEGDYVFALPARATVSDFAVWDGPTRIPAVILERKRAEEIYNQLKQQAIDPGLLQMGERSSDEAKRSSIFSARIVPIPPYGTKRLDFEYHQAIPVENFKSYFLIPLRPDAYQAQTARRFRINFELRSAHAIQQFQSAAKFFPLIIDEQTPNLVKAHFAAQNLDLTEDFVATFDLAAADSDTLRVIAHRNPVSPQPNPTETAPQRSNNEPGFFAVEALLGTGQGSTSPQKNHPAANSSPKTIIILMDVSLSMQWEKLERSFQALATLLSTLQPTDNFNLLLFNSETQKFQSTPVPASNANIQRALDFVRASRLRGGTNLQRALADALAQSSPNGAKPYLVLLTDGGATSGIIQNGQLAKWYNAARNQLPASARPKTYIFGVGDDANLPLLKMLAREDGVLESVLSTEPVEFKLASFLSKIGRSPVGQLQLAVSPDTAVDSVYPLQDAAFSGSIATWVGRYQKPQQHAQFSVTGVRDETPLTISDRVTLPRESPDHPQLPRLWARARVDALLEKIERDGEDQATIDEIIRLARQYKFVTPYTSFLAAPRALLRPRVIRPGDPVLRVTTDASTVSVIALFPFGLIQKLRHLPSEKVWQTRFYAPADLPDGTHTVRLILRDRSGHTTRETKTFVIASQAPVVQIHLEQKRYHPGQTINLKVSASQNTRTLIAQLDGAAPVSLKWDRRSSANTGQLQIPTQILPGRYMLTVTAEDLAHNMGSQGVDLEIVP